MGRGPGADAPAVEVHTVLQNAVADAPKGDAQDVTMRRHLDGRPGR